jgi:hypothetical protein
MSGLPHLKKSMKSANYRRVYPLLFASVHGVSVVILWSPFDPRKANQFFVVNSALPERTYPHDPVESADATSFTAPVTAT